MYLVQVDLGSRKDLEMLEGIQGNDRDLGPVGAGVRHGLALSELGVT